MIKIAPQDIVGSKVFIAGGAGFIGTHLASKLANDNEIFDNLHNCAFATSNVARHPNVRLIKGDVLHPDALRRALDSDIEYFVHAAAIAGVDTVIANPLRVLEVNVKGTFNVVEAALGLPKLKKLVDISTSEVLGKHADNVSEIEINPTLSVNEPRWSYAISKLVGEFIVYSHFVQNSLPTVTLRPFNIYGPNQIGVGAIHHFAKRAIDHEELVIHNDGSQIRAWCYIDDFVQGTLLAMKSTISTGRTYNIGNPRGTVTVRDLAGMIKEIAVSKSPLVFKPIDYSEVTVRIPDISLARGDLGYEPAIDLKEGLRRTVEWYRLCAKGKRG